ncbi:hypothetical protein OGW03_05630 [Citrobacter sp. Cf079]|nr:hypothetical protein [Citrobacter sp. Cf079]MDM3235176.1 hypothetical protein [Citrobacter sp. Cf079]
MQHLHAEAVLSKNDKWDNALSVLNTHPDLTAIESGREQSLGELVTSSVESIYTALTSGWTMMLGYSSGKDSEAL